ncbi:DUF6625 family protein [Limosilactobacillus secaliphilus]|uniref:Uncharacterized protein n=1 Tax=Limosilactobacillus secaliphilus TaxID=396268 RepID=A0A0R2I433_9LACO|nr:DUF6625 family protein [Limosilactobacillus secaliphilus]KRN58358.1 hypothetical protein IV45_GL000804 [Limosilactobacillus secaliphilus]
MKICIIVPYFGEFPPYINTFLYSASFNKEIEWLIFTDQSVEDVPNIDNVTFIKSTFKEVRERIQSVVGKNIVLDTPYKLCDYKPLYGLAFSDYLRDYDYWGYGDIDIVCGKIMKFIQPGLTKRYDRIGDLGHFCLYKNNHDVNTRYLLPVKDRHGNEIRLFDRVYSHSRGYAFDELGIRAIYKYYHFDTYKNEDLVNETKTGCLDIYSIDPRFHNYQGAFIWNKGKCLYYYLDPKSEQLRYHEFGYFHLIKRHQFTHFINKRVDCFGITTNGYHQLDNLNDSNVINIMNKNHSSYSKRLKYMIHSYFFSGDITFRNILGIHLPLFELFREIKNHTLRV